jgi:hypothetical protein
MQEEEIQMTVALTVLEGLPELIPSDVQNLIDQEDREGRASLSHSSLNTQLACHQRYAYSYVDKIEPISKAASLRLGGAFAKATETGDPADGVAKLSGEATILTQEDQDRLTVDCAIVTGAARAYLAAYGRRERREFGYRVRLRNPDTGAYSRTFDLEGYADGLTDDWMLIEDKFVGQMQAVAIKRLKLDRQLALECYGIWRATGHEITDVSYRFTRKPSIKQKKTETVEEYAERVEADYAERPEFYLVEEKITRSATDLVRIEAELWQWAAQRREAARARIYPRNSSHCHDYGGCPFLPLCVGDPDAPSLFKPKVRSDRQPSTQNEEDKA